LNIFLSYSCQFRLELPKTVRTNYGDADWLINSSTTEDVTASPFAARRIRDSHYLPRRPWHPQYLLLCIHTPAFVVSIRRIKAKCMSLRYRILLGSYQVLLLETLFSLHPFLRSRSLHHLQMTQAQRGPMYLVLWQG
jgi:hypothetical protein